MSGKILFEIASFDRSSHYLKYLKDIQHEVIPPQYIEQITVFFSDGSVVDIEGDDISMPVPVSPEFDIPPHYNTQVAAEKIRIFLDMKTLEKDCDKKVNYLLECLL